MADWDANSPQLEVNLRQVLSNVKEHATQRSSLTLNTIREWHRQVMSGLDVPNRDHIGAFRGEPRIQGINVGVGTVVGVVSSEVLNELRIFNTTLQKVIGRLDELVPSGAIPNEDAAAAVLELCGWAHAEWVRIHPFVNGNGRTARLLANYLAMRYRLPLFVRLRPRPDGNYAAVAAMAMRGIWEPTSMYFAELYLQQLKRPEDG